MRLIAPVLVLLAAAPAFGTISVTAPPARDLMAGERVTIAWSALPAGVEELEILLSLDGGRSYPVRLTPSMDPGRAVFEWIVPNLPATRARVRLRMGIGGRESESDASAPFQIARAVGAPIAPLDFRDGEWWIGESDASGFPFRSLQTGGEPSLVDFRAPATMWTGPNSASREAPSAGRSETTFCEPVHGSAAVTDRSSAPRTIPQRR
jgi:hypothetical protein